MIRQTVLPFKLERTDETLTAHGGLALLAEYTHALGLRALVARDLPRPGSNRGYAPSVFVETVVLLLQAGGRTLEDLRELEREDALLRLFGHDALPDPDTVGDWLRRMGDPTTGQAGLQGLGQVRDALTARLLRRDGVEAYTLDVDATLIEAEKRDAQWSYQGVKGYMPLLGFLFETPVCLVGEFRDGNVSPGAGHLAFYPACQIRLPAGKRIGAYRADSASYQAELINALEADGVSVVYASDPEPFWWEGSEGGLAERVHHAGDRRHAEWLAGADLLILDAQYTDAEYPAKRTWGHSPMEYAVDLAIPAGVRHLALFHHNPSRTDQALAQLVRRMRRRVRDHGSNLDVMAVVDGLEIELPGILHAVGPI